MEIKHLNLSLLFMFSFIICTNASNSDCIYNMYVQSGDVPSGGTQSNISIFLSDDTTAELSILNLKDWGLMGSDHNYLAHGNLDIFAGKAPCLRGPICCLIIVLEGFDDWYCDFIEVTVVGLGTSCSQKRFTVKKWIDNNRGTAVVLQNECEADDDDDRNWRSDRINYLLHTCYT